VVLVGDPGAGKSTFLRRIAFAACKAHLGQDALDAANLLPRPCPFPILIRAATLAEFIRTHRCTADYPVDEHDPAWLTHFPGVGDQLGGDSLLMLDGLDEVADPVRRKNIARLLDKAARKYESARIVATSRPPAYGGETVIPGFVTVQIGPLEDEAISAFLENWCRALHGEGDGAGDLKSELLDAIESRREIRDMAVNPVMLTALAALHWNRVRLPDQRSELYESVLDWLAKAREEVRHTPPKQCLDLMQHLAYTMHSDPKGKQVEITRYKAAQVLAPRFRDVAEDQQHAAAEQFLDAEETESGIIIRRGNSLRFWHLTFQEYLAARALAFRHADRQRLLFEEGKLYQPDWRETVLLLAGVLCKNDPEPIDGFLAEVLDGLVSDAPLADRARCVGLIGRILQDLKSWNYRIADPRYQENLGRTLEVFETKAVREIDFQTRLEAAEALGQAGDPRLERNNWVRVEGGEFWMGAQKTDKKGKNYDPGAYDDESPVRRVFVSPFYMGRYPVTVFEYARFLAEKPANAATPGHWQQQLRYPNRPVVEVGWHDAAAYCAWAGGRLPTEAEWECAARAGREGVRYPWGNQEPDAYRANFWEGGPKQPTPVGLYPAGATPDGIQDLAGNVWEWTADWWGAYAESDERNPRGPGEGDRMVIRGGSWDNFSRCLRVSYRYYVEPDVRDDNFGFRCVRELLSL
jgi:formylglycine-generating enzyme required for sulfatase activity